MQALSSAHNHSCPPSAWQPLSSPGLRESGKNSQGRGTGGSYPQKSDLLPPWRWVGERGRWVGNPDKGVLHCHKKGGEHSLEED